MKYVVSLVSFFERYFIAHILIHRPFLKGVLKHSDHASVRVRVKKKKTTISDEPFSFSSNSSSSVSSSNMTITTKICLVMIATIKSVKIKVNDHHPIFEATLRHTSVKGLLKEEKLQSIRAK